MVRHNNFVNCLTNDNHNPNPLSLHLELSACQNGSRIFSTDSGDIPTPVSLSISFSGVSLKVILPHGGVYFIALSSKLVMTRSAMPWCETCMINSSNCTSHWNVFFGHFCAVVTRSLMIVANETGVLCNCPCCCHRVMRSNASSRRFRLPIVAIFFSNHCW